MKYFAGLIVGDTGSGKTHLAGTLPCKTLYLYVDRSALDTLEAMPGQRTLVELKSFKMLNDYIIKLRTQKHDYEAVVVDSFAQFLQDRRAELTGSKLDNIVKARVQDWGTIKEQGRLAVKDLAALPMHVVLLSMAKREMDNLQPFLLGSDGEPRRGPDGEPIPNFHIVPAIEGGLRNEIGGYLSFILYTYTGNKAGQVEYHVSSSKPGVDTKACNANQVRDLVDPTFSKLFDAFGISYGQSTETGNTSPIERLSDKEESANVT